MARKEKEEERGRKSLCVCARESESERERERESLCMWNINTTHNTSEARTTESKCVAALGASRILWPGCDEQHSHTPEHNAKSKHAEYKSAEYKVWYSPQYKHAEY